jgi:hypothetical protein
LTAFFAGLAACAVGISYPQQVSAFVLLDACTAGVAISYPQQASVFVLPYMCMSASHLLIQIKSLKVMLGHLLLMGYSPPGRRGPENPTHVIPGLAG